MLAPGKARKAKRVEVSFPASLIRSGGQTIDIEIRDLSFYGFRASAEPAFAPGEYVKLYLPPFGLVRARVTWAKVGSFGGAFATAVDVRKCLSAAASAAKEAPRVAGAKRFILPEPS
jgi:hypothetical protein